MSLFDTYTISNFAHTARIPLTVLNERELLAFAQSVEQYVVSALKLDPNIYQYNQSDVERAFRLAATNRGIHVLSDMKVPVEQRPEGKLTAVARGLYTPGDDIGAGVAPGFYEQFYQEFGRLKPKFVAFMAAERYRTISQDSFEPQWKFKIRYASINE